MNDEEFEAKCEEIRQENRQLLDEFENWLKLEKLSERTLDKHVSNVDFYINVYLLRDVPTRPGEGAEGVNGFLGYWFIRKAMWANKTSIRGNAASLKKFYAFLFEKGLVGAIEFIQLERTIKEEMPNWLKALTRYDDMNIDIDEL